MNKKNVTGIPFWGVYNLPVSEAPKVFVDELKMMREAGMSFEEILNALETMRIAEINNFEPYQEAKGVKVRSFWGSYRPPLTRTPKALVNELKLLREAGIPFNDLHLMLKKLRAQHTEQIDSNQ